MAVTLLLGMTESGKSYRAEKICEERKRCVIFDYAHCFLGDELFHEISPKVILEIFKRFSKRKTYKIILRPSRRNDDRKAFDLAASLALALGRTQNDRLLFVADEVDMVCSSNYQTKKTKELVNKGRHDNVDTLAIARTLQRIHTDLRANASCVYVFRLQVESSLRYFQDFFDRANIDKIKNLKKYHSLKWSDNGNIVEVDANGKERKIC